LYWTDKNASKVQRRYYVVTAVIDGSEKKSVQIGCKFSINIKEASGVPGETEGNLISLPCVPANLSIANIVKMGSVGDMIFRYNIENIRWEWARRFSYGWGGMFNSFDIAKAYWFSPVTMTYNLSVVGFVPSGIILVNITNATGKPGEREGNLIGWNSVKQKCNLDQLIPSASTEDMILKYNPDTQQWSWARRFPGGWGGQFNCFEPGVGYWFSPVSVSYQWSYDRS
jgi:hypothetical protein